MSERPDETESDPLGIEAPADAPTEAERALRAIALGAILGTVLALLARARERRGASPRRRRSTPLPRLSRAAP